MQAVVRSSDVIADLVLAGVRDAEWWVGVGVGQIDRLASSVTRSTGSAFANARDAVNAAKESSYGFAVRGDDRQLARAVEADLRLVAFIAARRSVRGSKRWDAVDLAREGLTLEQAASRLGVTHQAVSARLQGAGWEEEREARWLCGWLLRGSFDGAGDDH
jgi:hypothetical protein